MKEGIFLKNETNGGKLFKIIIISVLNSWNEWNEFEVKQRKEFSFILKEEN